LIQKDLGGKDASAPSGLKLQSKWQFTDGLKPVPFKSSSPAPSSNTKGCEWRNASLAALGYSSNVDGDRCLSRSLS